MTLYIVICRHFGCISLILVPFAVLILEVFQVLFFILIFLKTFYSYVFCFKFPEDFSQLYFSFSEEFPFFLFSTIISERIF